MCDILRFCLEVWNYYCIFVSGICSGIWLQKTYLMNAFVEYFKNIQEHNGDIGYIHSCPELMECIRQVGFLPLLESGIQGYAAESLMAEECRFTQFPDGSWEWPLWQWKGSVASISLCCQHSQTICCHERYRVT
jgi:hypothetical protein